jgi:hypothetical protein
MEKTMKVLLGSAAVVAATIFGASYANANPAIFPGGFVLADGNGGFGTSTGAKTHIVCTPSKNGNVNAFCKADVTPPSSGTATHFDFISTKFICTITCPDGTVVATKDWFETVSASGEATLECGFQKVTPPPK